MEKLLDKEFIETKEPKKRVMKKSFIRKGAMALALALTLSGPAYKKNDDNAYVVEAATRDKKKPKITFKGSKKLTAEEGEAVTIPKTTYSDNVTKKKKLKVGVTVKKGKKNYKTIANKIRKATINNKTTSVKFPEEGTYKITYTVTDLAKNAAVKTRTVVVNDKEEIIEEDTTIKKEDPITEEPTRTVVTTEQPTTTEAPTVTEQPKTEEPTVEDKDWPIYNYRVITKESNDEVIEKIMSDDNFSDKIDLNLENDFSLMVITKESDMLLNEEYLKFIGKITATDQYGKDISDKIVIYESDLKERTTTSDYGPDIYIFVEDDYGNMKQKFINIKFMEDPYLKPEDLDELELINNNPKVYIQRRKHENYSYNKKENVKIKKLTLNA